LFKNLIRNEISESKLGSKTETIHRGFDVQRNLSKPNPEYDGFMCKPNLKSLLKSTV